jgi:predicted O-methyltransferase YrrM
MTTQVASEYPEAWLRRLYELNRVIAASGEQVAGNLFYDHNQDDYLKTPPVAFNRDKRDRFRQVCEGRKCMLEIGVNGGHSAYLALTANPELEFHGVDIGEHAYVRPVVEWLQAEFPGRVSFYEGDCLKVLPALARAGLRPDLFHVDGAKHTYYFDILNCQRMLSGPALVVIDDVNMGLVERVWKRCLREGLVVATPDFPPMPERIEHRNAVGMLAPVPRWRRLIYRLLAESRRLKRRIGRWRELRSIGS